MGFRSTITSEHYSGSLPYWFKDKYKDRLCFPDGLLLASITEFKYYSNDLFEDFQKCLHEINWWVDHNLTVTIAVLHEDSNISKVIIGKDDIKYFWMKESFESDQVWMQ